MMKTLLSLLAIACLLGCADSTSAQRTGDVPYGEATYEFSNSPAKVVLQVVTSAGLTARGYSMTVYGDGQVELQHVYNARKVIEERQIQLDEGELRHVLDLAVKNGVAEWEPSTITAWMRQSNGQTPIVADGLRVQISLHLEEYRRGEYALSPLNLSIGTNSPQHFAEWYPEIKQFQGAKKLVEWLESRWAMVAETRP